MTNSTLKTSIECDIEGFYVIRDAETKDIIVERHNAINFENMSLALAKALAHKPDGFINEIVFGNGGSTIDNLGTINYLPPNVAGQNAVLYNETYSKVVDNASAENIDPARNKVEISHTSNTYFTDVVVTATLDYGEPSGQLAFDDSTNASDDAEFIFDEFGLRSFGGDMLTHAIFHPVQKALNRSIEIIYTIRISVS